MKVLVTGASGYLGEGIVDQLLKDNIEVIATDIVPQVKKNIDYYQVDLFNIEDPYTYFGRPDVCLHLAWRDGFKHDSDTHISQLPHHVHFVEKLIHSGIEKVSVMGSVHEIGFYEGSITEHTPTNPRSKYGIAKNALRQIIEIETERCGVYFQWIRGFYIVGNSTRGCSVFSKITDAERRGEKTFPFTKGDNQFDFIDYDEVCFQIASIIEQDKIGGIINACSGYPEKIGNRVERFIKEMNYCIKLSYGEFPSRPYDSKAIWGNNEKIKTILNQREMSGR